MIFIVIFICLITQKLNNENGQRRKININQAILIWN
jgi:hypothetical protein